MDGEDGEPRGMPEPAPEGAGARGTEDTREEEGTSTEDEETTESSRAGEDTSVVREEEEVSAASCTGGILRLRAR